MSLSQCRGKVDLVSRRNKNMPEVQVVCPAPDGKVLHIIERQVVGEDQLYVYAVVVPQGLQTEDEKLRGKVKIKR